MTIKETLLEEIEQAPDFLLEEVLDFLLFTKSRHTLEQLKPTSSKLPYRPASGRSFLRHAGKWAGDDQEKCLQMVYDSRGEVDFHKHEAF
jgi:hypothetical protein